MDDGKVDVVDGKGEQEIAICANLARRSINDEVDQEEICGYGGG